MSEEDLILGSRARFFNLFDHLHPTPLIVSEYIKCVWSFALRTSVGLEEDSPFITSIDFKPLSEAYLCVRLFYTSVFNLQIANFSMKFFKSTCLRTKTNAIENVAD